MTRTALFHRDFRGYTGGHGKVWDYFRHFESAHGWRPRIYLTPRSVQTENPWYQNQRSTDPEWHPASAHALFLAGLDWRAYPTDEPNRPVINLVQHVRHGDPDDARHPYLMRRAIRICVSEEVANAITDGQTPNGPVLVVDAGVQLPPKPPTPVVRSGIFIDAIKQPELGVALAERLSLRGWKVDLNRTRKPRADYLQSLAKADISVLLPHREEGFYLPGIEAMALGCATIVPDCIGNRSYIEPGVNAMTPPLVLDELVRAVKQLEDLGLRDRLRVAGQMTARRFTIERERQSFHEILANLDELWNCSATS